MRFTMARSAPNITREEVARVLDLQQRAYETLLWLSHVSFARPEMLNEQTADIVRDATRCRQWIAEHLDRLPPRLRPPAAEFEAFALLFSSFFQTSFRIERRHVSYSPPHYVIATNRDEAAGKKKLQARAVPHHLRRKRANEAQHLEYRALTLVNEGPEDTKFWQAAQDVRGDETVRPDLLIWTYACELVHRARGEPHGPAVHLVWKQIPKDVRQHLTADIAWRARERVAQALRRSILRAR
jgi:hypothetical protein